MHYLHWYTSYGNKTIAPDTESMQRATLVQRWVVAYDTAGWIPDAREVVGSGGRGVAGDAGRRVNSNTHKCTCKDWEHGLTTQLANERDNITT